MFSYENGVAVAFILWAFSVVRLVVMVNSQMEKNLNKVGKRLSWLTLTPKPMQQASSGRWWKSALKFLVIAALGVPFVFFSWLYVLVALVLAYFLWEKSSGKPDSVRELQWKMKNLDMSFDDIIKASMKATSTDPDMFDQVKAEMLEQMEMNRAS